ncbi:MAG: transporter [Bacteroidales bacterium]|nr:transporter [Bacteroidales bacterium]
MKGIQYLRDWALIIAMVSGVAGYFIFVNIPLLERASAFAREAVDFLQPALIFMMLFFTFCKIDPHHLRLSPWHGWLLLIQCGLFTLIGLVLVCLPHSHLRVVLEGAMICFICPTATAAAVITRKLGGNVEQITTYTILINLAAALLIPALLPFVHPNPDMTVFNASMLILGKVFPLLLLPLVLALLVRYLAPPLHAQLLRMQDAPFYLWLVALTLAMVVTTRSIVHSQVPLSTQGWLVVVSLASCALQFWAGRKIGAVYGDKVTAGQALGQKNTVLAIWLGYTFFTPITSIVGGFYSIWHNLVNSYQLYKAQHRPKAEGSSAQHA